MDFAPNKISIKEATCIKGIEWIVTDWEMHALQRSLLWLKEQLKIDKTDVQKYYVADHSMALNWLHKQGWFESNHEHMRLLELSKDTI